MSTNGSGEGALFDLNGERKYLTHSEAQKLLAVAQKADRQTRLFCRLLYYTGCRVSEALQTTPRRIDQETGRIIFRTLKRRKTIYRGVPVPAPFASELAAFAQANALAPDAVIFPWCRQTAWRRIRALADAAGITGPQATPKGFRHQYGCHGIGCGLPESLMGRLLGHSNLKSTQIYTFVTGIDERALALRMWGGDPEGY